MAGWQKVMNVPSANPKVAQAVVTVQLPVVNGTGQGSGTARPQLINPHIKVGWWCWLWQRCAGSGGKDIHNNKFQLK